jgi:hypothetical protein
MRMHVHPIHRVERFEIVGPFTLSLVFSDGVSRTIDFSAVLAGELYGPLRDERRFRQVYLDRIAHTVAWPNGADFDPTILHDWPEFSEEMMNAAAEWKRAENP